MPRSAAPPRRFDTMNDILVPLLNNRQESPLANFPRAASLLVSDVELGDAHRIVLDSPPRAISFQVSGANSGAVAEQLVAAGLRQSPDGERVEDGYSFTLDSQELLESLQQQRDDAESDIDEYDREDDEFFRPPAPQEIMLLDAAKPEISFEEWLIQREAAATPAAQ
ncbi:hypothetical protein AURDEDRAFT_112089 [Auricularia subglabra TFB-10046 SS5]|nr:hypothetical protein AURDEDRAFT_112089 [Auricularia subglabra TFB-10046 SS5]